ncbi:MAG TPA: hypothetical protein VJ960_03685 [Oceanipulchritudo sp.]|nr:hypothetical protein [Oceanipulchritudo sp.]
MQSDKITLPCVFLIGFQVEPEAMVYSDPWGGTSDVSGTCMDIESVEVRNGGEKRYLTIRVGDTAPLSTDSHARYMAAFDTVYGGESGTFPCRLDVTADPSLSSFSLEMCIFLPEESIDESGAWSYIPHLALP